LGLGAFDAVGPISRSAPFLGATVGSGALLGTPAAISAVESAIALCLSNPVVCNQVGTGLGSGLIPGTSGQPSKSLAEAISNFIGNEIREACE
tara:strand:- start:1359 stop:1637 length:279 start_codon:yes stop_codon:yes gene_type:complete